MSAGGAEMDKRNAVSLSSSASRESASGRAQHGRSAAPPASCGPSGASRRGGPGPRPLVPGRGGGGPQSTPPKAPAAQASQRRPGPNSRPSPRYQTSGQIAKMAGGGHSKRGMGSAEAGMGDLEGLCPDWAVDRRGPRRKGPQHRIGHFHRSSQSDSFSKEHFLKANCQFVVSSAAEASVLSTSGDPDAAVDWAAVEELRVWAGDEPTACPICLYPPTAGKMGRCGHVFCWPCILHYLALSDRQWRKCPICYEPIYPQELKSFLQRPATPPALGQSLKLSLMCRPKGSAEALPVQPSPGEDGRYAKVLGMSDDDVLLKIVQRERRELDFALATEAGTPEICFVQQALEELEKRVESVHLRSQPPKEQLSPGRQSQAPSKAKPATGTVYVDAFYEIEDHSPPKEAEDEPAADAVEKPHDEIVSVSVEAADEKEEVEEEKSPESPDGQEAYFFYQAEDGQGIFLHPINAKMLVAEYGSLAKAPAALEAKVVELESATINERFRSRFRYLGHLPLASSIQLAELAFHPPLVSGRVRADFGREVKARAEERRKRGDEERRRAAKAAMWDRALLLQQASASQVSAHLQGSGEGPPEVVESTFVPSAQHQPPPPSPPTPPPFDLATDFGPSLGQATTEATAQSPGTSPPQPSPLQETPSFAQMLRGGKKVSGGGAWGKPPPPALPSQSLPRGPAAAGGDSDPDLPAPSYSNAFGDALASALHGAHLQPQQPQGKKKKKAKHTLLFST